MAYANVLGELAAALVARAHGPGDTIARYERQRAARVLLSLVIAIAIGCVATFGVQKLLQRPNVADGKPWRASSSWAECDTETQKCGSVSTRVFFHTQEDATPWLEIDLRAPTAFSSLTIKNRSDCCDDRAVPLVVEVSNDQQNWTEVARKKAVFSVWRPKFATQHARYVRVRVARKSWLHLEKVAVHP